MAFLRDRFLADPFTIRAALMRYETGALRSLSQSDREVALLVLAEVLNNVTEHGYCGNPGPVSVCLWRDAGALRARVTDKGRKAPGLPPVAPDHDPATLPEGGFGVGLIRHFTRKLVQRHRFGCNILSFRFIGDNCDLAGPSFPMQRN